MIAEEFHQFLYDYFDGVICGVGDKFVCDEEFVGDPDLTAYLKHKVSCLLSRQGVNEKTGEKEKEKTRKKDYVFGNYRDLVEEEQWEALDVLSGGLEEHESRYNVGDLRIELTDLRKKKDSCGTVRAVVSCGDITHGVEYESRKCWNRTCIYCGSAWRTRQVNATVERFEALDHIMEQLPKRDVLDLHGKTIVRGVRNIGRLKHISISPPQE